MRCHYILTDDGEKVLIPGCMGTAVHNDTDFCTCDGRISVARLETKSYNAKIKAMREEIDEMQAYIDRLEKQLGIK